jgi:hypothetical protein
MQEDQPFYNRSTAWVFIIAWLFAFLPLAYFIYAGMKGTGGIFSYPVDDTYIHLKIAQNLAIYGNWGINPGEFNSASSSVLYTILLAALIKIFQAPLLIPLVINAIAGTILLWIVCKWLGRQGLSAIVQLLILSCLVFFTPLPVLMLSGMEHVLQCLFAFLFLISFANWAEDDLKNRMPWKLVVYGILLVATRYEGMFLIAGACLVLLYKKRTGNAFVLGGLTLLPVLFFGLISVMKGSFFLPNSLIVKSQAAQFSFRGLPAYLNNIIVEKFMFAKAGITLLATQRLLILLPLTWIISRRSANMKPYWSLLLIILTIATFLQLALADTGKFYRYEASLVMLSVIFISVVMVRTWKIFATALVLQ